MVLWAGGWASKFFFSDLTCGVKALKPCTQTGVCGACARSLGALGTGVRPPAGTALSLPRSVFCGWLFILSFYVVRAAYNITYDRYFSQSAPPFLLKLFSGLPTSCRGVRFSSLLGSVPAFAPVELAFTFFPSSRAMMGLELGLYAHILGLAFLSQFARFPRHVAFLRLRLGFVAGVLPSCSEC